MEKIKVVVVDDSALVRSILGEMINRQPDMVCVGLAHDPFQARELIRQTDPHVITLDVEMPRMDGLDFLEKIMRLRPTPVVMISTLTERGAEVTLRALELGAIDFVAKPKLGVAQGMQAAMAEITDKIRIASKARLRRQPAPVPQPLPAAAKAVVAGVVGAGHATAVQGSGNAAPKTSSAFRGSTEKIVAIYRLTFPLWLLLSICRPGSPKALRSAWTVFARWLSAKHSMVTVSCLAMFTSPQVVVICRFSAVALTMLY
jgi:two-component system, chemotaxis family, protein-glutamate methylesterase/glutaminase